jgi:hypothetical protein
MLLWLFASASGACTDKAPSLSAALDSTAAGSGAFPAPPAAGAAGAAGQGVSSLAVAAAGSPARVEERDAGHAEMPVTAMRARTQLVDPDSWRQAEASDDPFVDRPAVVECPSDAVTSEIFGGRFALDVQTGPCRYFTGLQASLRNVLPGDRVHVVLAHFELTAPDAAEAHFAIRIGDVTIVDERVQIPSAADVVDRYVAVDHKIPAGSPVVFHLHNHGANSWALLEISAGP